MIMVRRRGKTSPIRMQSTDKDKAAFIIVKSNRSTTQQAERSLISCHAGQQREVRHGPCVIPKFQSVSSY